MTFIRFATMLLVLFVAAVNSVFAQSIIPSDKYQIVVTDRYVEVTMKQGDTVSRITADVTGTGNVLLYLDPLVTVLHPKSNDSLWSKAPEVMARVWVASRIRIDKLLLLKTNPLEGLGVRPPDIEIEPFVQILPVTHEVSEAETSAEIISENNQDKATVPIWIDGTTAIFRRDLSISYGQRQEVFRNRQRNFDILGSLSFEIVLTLLYVLVTGAVGLVVLYKMALPLYRDIRTIYRSRVRSDTHTLPAPAAPLQLAQVPDQLPDAQLIPTKGWEEELGADSAISESDDWLKRPPKPSGPAEVVSLVTDSRSQRRSA